MDQRTFGASRHPRQRHGPLAGVRIADFTHVAAGPLATRLLADLGAEVIKIEDGHRTAPRRDMARRFPVARGAKVQVGSIETPDSDPNASSIFNNYNRNKLSVAIDLRQARGRDLCERIIARSSVVVENFAPGVMERWGFTYERLDAISPELIYVRMSGFGHSGPHRSFRSYGPLVQAVTGLSHLTGLPGHPPSGIGLSYMDNQAGYHASNALLAALHHRNRTGKGTEIDLSSVEAGIALTGPALLDVTVNGRSTREGDYPYGNRAPDHRAAPHGVYPAEGEDCWIAIAVFDDGQWQALRAVMGEPDWACDPRFDKAAARYADQDALDARIAAWTGQHDRHALMHRLQAHGVPAAAVQRADDTVERDPQLAARGLYFELDHPVCGPSRFEGVPIAFSRTEVQNWRSSPLVGEDSEHVLKTILGMDDAEYDELHAAEVIS